MATSPSTKNDQTELGENDVREGSVAKADVLKGNVLVVDDEYTNRAVLCKLLEREGYVTAEAADGYEALEKIVASKFDLVMLDISMPGMDGFEVLQNIRMAFNEMELPVIMVTADGISERAVRAFQAGANDYILKPYDAAVAMARVEMHTQFKRSREALEKTQERYSLVARGTNDGLWDWNLGTGEIYYSPRWYSLLDIDPVVQPTIELWLDQIHSEDFLPFQNEMNAFRQGLTSQLETELRMRHCDGSYRWALCRGTAVRDKSGMAIRMAGSLTDITNGKVADALTGLPNRVLFLDRLSRCAARRQRENFQFAVLYLDLDNFKQINDGLGHEAGDQMLVAIARRLEGSLRESDSFVCRLGGDEFVILVEGVSSIEEPIAVAERIISSVASPVMIGEGREVFASVSVGIAYSQDSFDDTSAMMQAADTAMYRAKAKGKSCYRVFDPVMKDNANERLDIENELHHSIEREDFEVHYQPIINLKTSRITGLESLIRWTHPRLGSIAPDQFIPIAEETGMIKAIGRQVFRKSCTQFAIWKSTIPQFADLSLSVNVSSLEIHQPNFVETILKVLSETNLQPDCLQLELTESAIMRNPEQGAKVLADLCDAGIRVAIDDFGTGYSSLSYLFKMLPDSVKIDRSFIEGICSSSDKKAIVTAIVTLCKGMKLNVVAEGIETPEQEQLLTDMGCEFAQGFFYSKAIAKEDVPDMVLEFYRHNRCPSVTMPIIPSLDVTDATLPTLHD